MSTSHAPFPPLTDSLIDGHLADHLVDVSPCYHRQARSDYIPLSDAMIDIDEDLSRAGRLLLQLWHAHYGDIALAPRCLDLLRDHVRGRELRDVTDGVHPSVILPRCDASLPAEECRRLVKLGVISDIGFFQYRFAKRRTDIETVLDVRLDDHCLVAAGLCQTMAVADNQAIDIITDIYAGNVSIWSVAADLI